LYFENKRSAPTPVVSEKCRSVPAAGCQQLVRKISQQQGIFDEFCGKTVFVFRI